MASLHKMYIYGITSSPYMYLPMDSLNICTTAFVCQLTNYTASHVVLIPLPLQMHYHPHCYYSIIYLDIFNLNYRIWIFVSTMPSAKTKSSSTILSRRTLLNKMLATDTLHFITSLLLHVIIQSIHNVLLLWFVHLSCNNHQKHWHNTFIIILISFWWEYTLKTIPVI